VVLARELTKKFEEWLRGTPEELLTEWNRRPRKGEFVVMIGAAGDTGGKAGLPQASSYVSDEAETETESDPDPESDPEMDSEADSPERSL
jgi:16S rRNA (cytidine1402-2'-O)-methyltransferase